MPRLNSLNTFAFSSSVSGAADPEQPNYQGAKMIFVQTTAPTGWTKDTTSNDHTLRGVSGTVSSGGSVNFSTAMASRSLSGSLPYTGTLGATTLTTPQIPAHNHPGIGATRRFISPATAAGPQTRFGSIGSFDPGVISTHPGTTTGHTHTLTGATVAPGVYATLNLAVRYVDVILATRD